METKSGLHLQVIVPALVLALSMNPFAYAQSQQPAPPRPEDPQSAQATHDTSDIPAMPPEHNSDAASPALDQLPDSPGTVQLQSAQLVPPMPAQTQPPQQQPPSREPVGTAAAETVPTMGVAASRPAGAALAPAKQRRVRTILIRMGAVLGAGAAVGLTMALSEGSPSKPPGAR